MNIERIIKEHDEQLYVINSTAYMKLHEIDYVKDFNKTQEKIII